MQNGENLYLIGEVSKLCNIPIKTLRYYDDIGLLKPEKTDSQNNYRHYSKEQLVQIIIIKDFKLMGFSLAEIKELLKRDSLRNSKDKLAAKYDEIGVRINELQTLQTKLRAVIDGYEYDKAIKVEVKNIPPIPVAYTRYHCPCNPSAFIERFCEIFNLLEKHHLHKTGPLMAVFHDHYTQFDYANADIEICVPIAETTMIDQVTRSFGGFMAAIAHHKGSYRTTVNTYQSVISWLDANGYSFTGSAVESYIIDAGTTIFEENYVTELILPVKKNN